MSEFDNDFKIVTDAALMVTFNLSLLLQRGAVQDGLVPLTVLGVALIVVNFIVPLVLVIVRGWKWRKESLSQSRATRDKRGEAPPDEYEFDNPVIGADE